MKGRIFSLLLVCPTITGLAAFGIAQNGSGPSSTAQLKQVAYIKASNTKMDDHFGNGGTLEGHGVAISGDGSTLAVGAPYESSGARGIDGNQNDNSVYNAGAVYIFVQQNNNWSQQAYIKASNPGQSYKFGFHVSLSQDGNTLAVSAPGEASAAKGINGDQNDKSIALAGAVYVFTRTGTTWTQQAYIKASNTGEPGVGDQFRRGTGAIYVFTRTGTTWSQTAYLKASNAENGDSLGYAIAISQDGNTIAGGAADEDCMTSGIVAGSTHICQDDQPQDNSSGAVYIFVRTGTTWTQQAFIKSSNPDKEDWFGSRLTLSGDGNTLAAGAQVEDGGSKGINGDQKNQSAEDT